MKTRFAEVLAREDALLSAVTNRATLTDWRRHLTRELMTPQSPYAATLRQASEVADRAAFLNQWREMIAEMVQRVLHSEAGRDAPCCSGQPSADGADAKRTAVLILAALHGGGTLSRVAQDPQPLNAALDLALAHLAAIDDNNAAKTSNESST